MTGLRLEVGDILFAAGIGGRAELGRLALCNGEIADCVHQNLIVKARPQFESALFTPSEPGSA